MVNSTLDFGGGGLPAWGSGAAGAGGGGGAGGSGSSSRAAGSAASALKGRAGGTKLRKARDMLVAARAAQQAAGWVRRKSSKGRDDDEEGGGDDDEEDEEALNFDDAKLAVIEAVLIDKEMQQRKERAVERARREADLWLISGTGQWKLKERTDELLQMMVGGGGGGGGGGGAEEGEGKEHHFGRPKHQGAREEQKDEAEGRAMVELLDERLDMITSSAEHQNIGRRDMDAVSDLLLRAWEVTEATLESSHRAVVQATVNIAFYRARIGELGASEDARTDALQMLRKVRVSGWWCVCVCVCVCMCVCVCVRVVAR